MLQHSLGLSLIRQNKTTEAVEQLRLAAESEEATPRFALVYAIALSSTDSNDAALAYLQTAMERFPNYPQLENAAAELANQDNTLELFVGETKVHLHDASLPDFGELVELIVASHTQDRGVAVHCVTEVELVFTLSAFRAAGTNGLDRVSMPLLYRPSSLNNSSNWTLAWSPNRTLLRNAAMPI